MSSQISVALIAGFVALLVSVLSGVISYIAAERRLRSELKLEHSAENAVKTLLSKGWPLRSFDVLKYHLKGFDDDELRKLLIRSGAIAFSDPDGKEVWGLLSENVEKLATRDALEAQGLTFDEISNANQTQANG